MRNTLLSYLLVCSEMIVSQLAFSQNIFPSAGAAGIGTTSPNAASLLEVQSTTKGVLLPRMTKAQRDAIASPVQGLLIYQTSNTPGLYYYEGSWTAVSGKSPNKSLSNLTAPTAVNVALLPGTTNSIDLGAAAMNWKNIYAGGSYYIGSNKVLDIAGTGNSFIGVTSNTQNTGESNTAVGNGALHSNTTGSDNTAIGHEALWQNTTGYANVANGDRALWSNTTGYQNIANGFGALFYNTTGSKNTATGWSALFQNTTGFQNTATGWTALYNNTTGYGNIATGYWALLSNTNGDNNVATGNSALFANTIGDGNTATGSSALRNNIIGSNNTADGYSALDNNQGGSYNTALGSLADVSSAPPNLSNATVIGSSALVDASNKVRIGNASVLSNGGQVSWTTYSDGRIKNEVKENVPGLSFIKELRPVTFHYDVKKENELLGVNDTANWEGKYDIEKIQFTGFIAQEVGAAAQKIGYDFSGVDKSGKILGLRYADFVVPMVKAIQELSEKSDQLSSSNDEIISENKNLKNQIANLQTELNDLKSVILNSQSKISTDGFAKLNVPLLGQNIPNPFGKSTLIPFRIPKDCHDASIMITNASTSQVISVIPISCNEDHLSIDADVLSSGTYSYTLFMNGNMIDTKSMVISK